MQPKSRICVLISNTYRNGSPPLLHFNAIANSLFFSFSSGNIDVTDINFKSMPYNRRIAYSNSKLMNVLFAAELDRRLKAAKKDIGVFAINPGVQLLFSSLPPILYYFNLLTWS